VVKEKTINYVKILSLSRLRILVLLISLFSILFGQNLYSQNLVKNPSFEETNNIFNPLLYVYVDSFPGVKHWFTPLNNRLLGVTNQIWENSNGNLNTVFPRTDSAHAIVSIGSSWTNNTVTRAPKTFIQTKLKTLLESGCSYRVGMYYIFRHKPGIGSNTTTSNWAAANRVGLHLSAQRVRDQSDTTANGSPQVFAFDSQNIIPQISIPYTGGFYMDTTQYALLVDTFYSQGNEEYLTIGNFYKMSQTFAMSFTTGLVYIGISQNLGSV
jgi:hypothetical protein